MKYLYQLLFLSVFFPALSYAQSNFKPGYVVTLNGDTIHGFIDYKEWDQNPSKIYFKRDISSAQKERYSANEINDFEISGFENYKRAITWVSQDHLELSSLSHHVDSTKIKDTIFLRTIYKGNVVTLYGYKDKIKERFFIAEKDKDPVELSYHKYLDPNPDHTYNILIQDGYKLQLYNLVIKYTPQFVNITDQLQRTDYTAPDLSKIVAKINGSDNSKRAYSSRAGTRFFAGAGLNNQETSFTGNIGFNGERFSSLFPKINIGLDLYLNKNVGDWIFRTELYATGNKANAHTIIPENNYTDEESLKFTQYMVTINPQLLYNFYNTKTIKIYISIGAAFSYSAYSNEQYIGISIYQGSINNKVPRNFPDVQSLFFNLSSKIGLTLNNQFEIYAGYNPAAPLNDETSYTMSLSSYQFGINYLFGKNS